MQQLKWRVKALLEYLKFHAGILAATRTAGGPPANFTLPLCFISGCGRSGTTMLGRLLALHPAVSYLNEPRTFWIAVSPRTDIWGYTKKNVTNSLLISSPRPGEAKRLSALFISRMKEPKHKIVIEKSPENVFRLPWLHALAPQAKLIHIVRNCPDVIRSILVEADFDIPYGLRDMNNWYGSRDRKRQLLIATAKRLNIPEATLASCITANDWAALEWVSSLKSYRDFHHHFAKSGYYHLRYEDLLANPWQLFAELVRFLDLPAAPELKKNVIGFVRGRQPTTTVALSPGVRELVKAEQMQFGYTAIL